jgi:cellulose synthase/poly-beta-1,6-N-acetylglucosamine synthase-like glycosyltransferase
VQAVRDVGGWDPSVTTEDFDLWLRLAQSYSFRYVDEVTGSYRQVTGSKSRRYAHKLLDNQTILAKHGGQSARVDAAIARTIWLRWLYTAAQMRRVPDQSLANMARRARISPMLLVSAAPGLALTVVWLSLTAALGRLRGADLRH